MPDNEQFDAIHALLSPERDEAVAAYNAGYAVELISRRNRNLGSVLVSEKAAHYVLILYRMLLFSKDHELLPLHEDIYDAVAPAMTQHDGEAYTLELFNTEMRQLVEWKLLAEHIEKQRIRGYTDSRREKFRYGLQPETKELLIWLERRLLTDFTGAPTYSRFLLNDVRERLLGLQRELERFAAEESTSEAALHRAESCMYELSQIHELTERISSNLSELNAQLIGFNIGLFDMEAARDVMKELVNYEERYLSPLFGLRVEIVAALSDLGDEDLREELERCRQVVEGEHSHFRHFSGQTRLLSPAAVLAGLQRFYEDFGRLWSIEHRVNENVMRVYERISLHIRELDRKGNRLNDLKGRIREIAALPEGADVHPFVSRLLCWSFYPHDPHHWNAFEKAKVKIPQSSQSAAKQPDYSMPERPSFKGGKCVTLEQLRLREMRNWIAGRLGSLKVETPVSAAGCESFDDIAVVMDLARFHYLGLDRKLDELRCRCRNGDAEAKMVLDKASLRYHELYLKERS